MKKQFDIPSFNFKAYGSILDRNIQPTAVTKVAFNGTLFEVSWQPPYDPQRLVRNYTVFWCKPKNKRDRPYQVKKINLRILQSMMDLNLHFIFSNAIV